MGIGIPSLGSISFESIEHKIETFKTAANKALDSLDSFSRGSGNQASSGFGVTGVNQTESHAARLLGGDYSSEVGIYQAHDSQSSQALAFAKEAINKLQEAEKNSESFAHWSRDDAPTEAGVGAILIDPNQQIGSSQILKAINNFDSYRKNIKYVIECNQDGTNGGAIDFYQKIDLGLSVMGYGVPPIHYNLTMTYHNKQVINEKTYLVSAWHQNSKTDQLSSENLIRTDQNFGGWAIELDPETENPIKLIYFLHSYPKESDVMSLTGGSLIWRLLTSGADATAKKAVMGNLEGMLAFAAKQ